MSTTCPQCGKVIEYRFELGQVVKYNGKRYFVKSRGITLGKVGPVYDLRNADWSDNPFEVLENEISLY